MKKTLLILVLCLVAVLSGCQRDVYQEPTPSLGLPQVSTSISNDEAGIANEPAINEPIEIEPEAEEGKGLELLYTAENPAISDEEVNQLLRVVQQRYLEGIDKIGWYASYSMDRETGMWLHIADPVSKRIDQLISLSSVINYSNPLGDLPVLSILLNDGKNAYFSINEARDDTFVSEIEHFPRNEVYYLSKSLPMYFFQVDSFYLSAHLDTSTNTDVSNRDLISDDAASPILNQKAWIFQEGERQILQIERHWTGLEVVQEQSGDVKTIEQFSRGKYDWQSGEWLYEYDQYIYDNGTKSEYTMTEEDFGRYKYQYYENLPAEIQALYDDAREKVMAEYAKQGIN